VIFRLPTIHSERAGFEHLADLNEVAGDLYADRLELDFSRCKFFDANMAAPLAAVLTRIAEKFNTIEIVSVPPATERILRKNSFLTNYRYQPLEDANRTTIPFQRMQLSDQGRFSDYIERHLRGKGIPRMTQGLGKVFKQSVFEVFQNAVLHSHSKLGVFVCGQFFPQLQHLDFTLADAGVGFRTNVRRFLGTNISSADAIRWALEARNTTKTGAQPGGVGLKFLTDFVRLNRGKIQIVSRKGFYQCVNSEETFTMMDADFRGTAVNLEINTGDGASYCLASETSPDNIF
jgi:hypothetical protein